VLADGSAEALRDTWPDVNAERPYVIPRNLGEQIEAHFQGLT
jgi:hypothetical protein